MPLRPCVLTLATAAIVAAPALADCPASTYLHGGFEPVIPIVEVAAANDTLFSDQPCESMHGRYRVDAGLLFATTTGCSVYSSFANVTGLETIVEDDFTLNGPPPGTPVGFDAVLDLTGTAFSTGAPGNGGGRVRGMIYESVANQVSVQQSTIGEQAVNIAQSLTLHVNAVAGTPVRLRFSVRGESLDGYTHMEGRFRFANLPPGAVVQSCRGYTSAAPVPVRAASWGSLKTHHR